MLKCVGKKQLKLADGSEAIQFMFTIHIDDAEQTTLIHEVDGKNIPIILASMPIEIKSSALGKLVLQ